MIQSEIFLLFKFHISLLEPLYKFLTNALSMIQNLKLIISWHMSEMWLLYSIFVFCSEKCPVYQTYQR